MSCWRARSCAACARVAIVANVRPQSSVCTSRAAGATWRIASIASTTPRSWWTRARTNDRSLRACGYQWPYSALKRAVVIGSFTGVTSVIHG